MYRVRFQQYILLVILTVFSVSAVLGFSPKTVFGQVAPGVPLTGSQAIPVIDNNVVKQLGYKNLLTVTTLEQRLAIAKNSVSLLGDKTLADIKLSTDGDILEDQNKDIIDFDCKKSIEAIGANQGIDDLATTMAMAKKPGFLVSIIGGGKAEAEAASLQASKYTSILICISTYIKYIQDPKNLPVYSMDESFRLANHLQLFGNAKTAIEAKITQLNAQAKSGWKDVAKAAMLTAILKVNQNVTTNLINRAMQKYKINDYLLYIDAVATQIYAMKYIKQKYDKPSNRDVALQLAIRAAIMNPATQRTEAQILNYANKMAQEFRNKRCDAAQGAYEYGTKAYFKCVGANAAMEANPTHYIDQILDEAKMAMAKGQEAAQKEIADGYAPVRDCSGAVSQQMETDQDASDASLELKVATDAQRVLKTSETTTRDEIKNSNITPEEKNKLNQKLDNELKKADESVATAQKRYDDFNKGKVNGAIVDVCEAISSPAHFVSNSIDAFLKQHLDQATQLKTENLPFFANFFSNVVSNFLTNIILGGADNLGKKKQVIKESGVDILRNDGTGAAITTAGEVQRLTAGATNDATQGTAVMGANGNVDMYAYPQGGSATNKTLTLNEQQNYVLVIDFTALKNQGVTGVKIEGLDLLSGQSADTPVVPLSAQQLASGQIVSNLTPTSSFTLTITFYGSPDPGSTEPRGLGTYTQAFQLNKLPVAPPAVIRPPRSETTTGEGSNNGEVRGASVILPRGPAFDPGG